jgi:serpin B
LVGTVASHGYQLDIGNAAWFQSGLPIKPEYLSAIAAIGLEQPWQQIDFAANPAQAVDTINHWVDQKTNAMIPKLLAEADINSDTRFVLANAIYFNGRWTFPFDPQMTHPRPFYVTPEQRLQTPTMVLQQARILFGESDELTIGALPYGDAPARMEMIVVVPKPTQTLAAISGQLSETVLSSWLALLKPASGVTVQIPKFSLRSKFELADVLSKLGLISIFDPNAADFSGINADAELFIDKVVHEAVVQVDEAGTEAAAATAVIGAVRSSIVDRPKALIADRPFYFFIRDRDTGCILFTGQYVTPEGL